MLCRMSSGQRILVTGGAGSIGSDLCARLLDAGHQVTILDNLSTGFRSNIELLLNGPECELIVDSVLNESLVESLIAKCDRVYHLASAVGVKLVMEKPVSAIETTFGGTDIVLRWCARHHRPVFIASSSEVYGKGVTFPFREDDDVLTGPTNKHRWAYGCAKQLDEFLALAHWRESKLPVAIARLFNTVGPRQTGQYGMVIPRFVKAALANEPIVVFGDGEQVRCFAHVNDISAAIIKMLETPACFGQVTNLGNDEEITVNRIAQLTIELTHSKSEIRHIPYSQVYGGEFEDTRRRVPSLEKAKRLLGYQPTYDIRQIIEDVIKYQRRMA